MNQSQQASEFPSWWPLYERVPDHIYTQSFSQIAALCDFSGCSDIMKDIATRMIHACGAPEILSDIYVSDDIKYHMQNWHKSNATLITDVKMVRYGIINQFMPTDTTSYIGIEAEGITELATSLENTRSAAGIVALQEHIPGSVIVIGNAPTALFQLLELIMQGVKPPDVIIGIPVGFVGAIESKQALIDLKEKTDHLKDTAIITLKGRMGGSAIAAAALNAAAKHVC